MLLGQRDSNDSVLLSVVPTAQSIDVVVRSQLNGLCIQELAELEVTYAIHEVRCMVSQDRLALIAIVVQTYEEGIEVNEAVLNPQLDEWN